MAKTPEELYNERIKRVNDAIQLRVPDRVPFVPFFGFFPAYYAGITPEEAMYDYDKAIMASKKAIMDFEPDMYSGPAYFRSGPVLESLDCKQLKWPGHGVSPNLPYQYVEEEYMPVEEYDEFIENPSDWLARRYLPRTFGALAPFRKLPAILDQFFYYGAPSAGLAKMGTPEVEEAFKALLKAGRESARWVTALGSFAKDMKDSGFSPFFFVSTVTAFDLIADFFRGTRGAMLDMYRNPDKLLEAVERATPLLKRMAMARSVASGIPIALIPLNKGAEGLMSLEQYKTFYWPTLRKLIMGLIDEGLTPYLYTEGGYTSRLEVISDVPKGKVMYHFEHVDIYKAKEILGDVACFVGNVPVSLLATGTTQEVKDYCKKLIDVVGKGGGLIMDSGACIDEAKPENVKAMADFTREYGVYR